MSVLFRHTFKVNLIINQSFVFRGMSVAASHFLVNNPKYSFLKDLGLKEINSGVFDNHWKGSGPVSFYLTLLR